MSRLFNDRQTKCKRPQAADHVRRDNSIKTTKCINCGRDIHRDLENAQPFWEHDD